MHSGMRVPEGNVEPGLLGPNGARRLRRVWKDRRGGARSVRGGAAAGRGAGEALGGDFEWEVDFRDLTLGKMLGSGSFGDVYRGRCRAPQRAPRTRKGQ